jgi:hypothetical protein
MRLGHTSPNIRLHAFRHSGPHKFRAFAGFHHQAVDWTADHVDVLFVSLLRLIGIGVTGENAGRKTPAVNGRRHGRVRCELMKSSHGEVLDVSASGMRVTFKGAPDFIPGQEFDVDLETIEGCLTVGVRVIWIRKISITRFEAGMEFLGLSADQKQMLAYVARASSTNESLRPNDERGR